MNRKYWALLVLFVLFLYACASKPASEAMVGITSDTVAIPDTATADTLLVEDIPLNHILKQLGLKDADCYTDFISYYTLPNNKKRTIWVIPKIAHLEKDEYGNEAFDLDGYLLVADTETGKIVSRNYRPHLWSSDAYQLIYMSIDTTYTNLSKDRAIFGLVSSYQASTRVNPTGNSDAELFMQQGDSLMMILNYSRDSYHGENDGGYKGNGFMGDTSTELFRMKRRTNGLPDLVLVTSSTYSEWENNESVSNSFEVDSVRAFQFTGSAYKNISLNNGFETICKDTNEGGIGDRTCYYLGKSLREAYQSVYNKDQEGLKKWMLSELPFKDTEYNKTNDTDDEVSIKYTVESDSLINVSFDSDRFNLNYRFEQKNGFVVLVYSYND